VKGEGVSEAGGACQEVGADIFFIGGACVERQRCAAAPALGSAGEGATSSGSLGPCGQPRRGGHRRCSAGLVRCRRAGTPARGPELQESGQGRAWKGWLRGLPLPLHVALPAAGSEPPTIHDPLCRLVRRQEASLRCALPHLGWASDPPNTSIRHDPPSIRRGLLSIAESAPKVKMGDLRAVA
jgi:hypothetical protein